MYIRIHTVILSALLSLLTPLCSAQNIETILLFGDSIIAGYKLNEKDSVPYQVQTILKTTFPKIDIINGGVSGDTTTSGLGRIEWTLNKHKPDLVFIAIGGNDMLRGIPTDLTERNLGDMLEIVQTQNIPIILSEVQAPENYGQAYKQQYQRIFATLTKQYQVPLYPFLISKTFGKSDLMQSDGIHPNVKGAKEIANDLAAYLKTYIQKRNQKN